MKNFILYFSILFTFSIPDNLQAQQLTGLDFARENANWWHFKTVHFDEYLLREQVQHSFVSRDTLIQDMHAKIIEYDNYYYSKLLKVPDNPSVTFSTGDIKMITYATEDTIFFYNKTFNQFTPLYVYNIDQGDTFCLPVIYDEDLRPNPVAGGDTCFCLVLDSVRIVPYDEVYLETYFVSSVTGEHNGTNYPWPVYNWCESSTGGATPKGVYTKLGALYGFFPNLNNPLTENRSYSERPTSNDTLAHEIRGGLVCYQDDSFDIHIPHSNTMSGCYFDTALSVNNPLNKYSDLLVYPNPASNILIIEINKLPAGDNYLHILDITGRKIKKSKLNSNLQKQRIELNPLPIGQYILQITNEQNRWNQKLIVQH